MCIYMPMHTRIDKYIFIYARTYIQGYVYMHMFAYGGGRRSCLCYGLFNVGHVTWALRPSLKACGMHPMRHATYEFGR